MLLRHFWCNIFYCSEFELLGKQRDSLKWEGGWMLRLSNRHHISLSMGPFVLFLSNILLLPLAAVGNIGDLSDHWDECWCLSSLHNSSLPWRLLAPRQHETLVSLSWLQLTPSLGNEWKEWAIPEGWRNSPMGRLFTRACRRVTW